MRYFFCSASLNMSSTNTLITSIAFHWCLRRNQSDIQTSLTISDNSVRGFFVNSLIAIVFYSLFSTSMSRFAYVILVYSKETIKLLVFHSFCCISNKPPIESCESQIVCFTYSNLLAVYSQLHLYIQVCKNV